MFLNCKGKDTEPPFTKEAKVKAETNEMKCRKTHQHSLSLMGQHSFLLVRMKTLKKLSFETWK